MESKRHSLALVVAAFVIGFAAWSGPAGLLSLCALFPAIWYQANSRGAALLVSLAYYTGSTVPLLPGAGVFFGMGAIGGAGIWLLAGIYHSIPWSLFWASSSKRRAFLLPLSVFLTAIPPLGAVGWVHPLCASGSLFPTFGIFGLLLCFALVCTLPFFKHVASRIGITAMVLLVCVAHFQPRNLTPPQGWAAHETHLSNNAAEIDLLVQYQQQNALLRAANSKGGTVVFPESSSGWWSPDTAILWQQGLRSPARGALLGALSLQPFTLYYDNVIVGVSKDRSEVLYRQRMPSPISMWHPWRGSGARAHWFQNPVFEWEGKRVAAVVCHEQYLVWPIVHSLLQKPDLIIATGNLWWCKDTRLPRIQRTVVQCWAALANVPLIESYNQ